MSDVAMDFEDLQDDAFDLMDAFDGVERGSPRNDLAAFLGRLADACRALAADPAVADPERLSCTTVRDLLSAALGK